MEEATKVRIISTFVSPDLETSLVSVLKVPQAVRSSCDQEPRLEVIDQLGEIFARRTRRPDVD